MQYQNARIRRYRSGAAAMVASFLLMAVTAATAKPCLTKEEARKLWPNEWLYWHTERTRNDSRSRPSRPPTLFRLRCQSR